MNPIIALIAIAIVYVSFSVFAQRKIANYKRIKEIKKEMDAKMKELLDLPLYARVQACMKPDLYYCILYEPWAEPCGDHAVLHPCLPYYLFIEGSLELRGGVL